ncbi:hypothetical protein, partial [Ruegeria pomeroyi]|uniref:hypothetical protein n=1 Tax=Ruegeria pomeroyi TaxID=89184 RepID=UPI00241C3ED6
PTHPEQPPTPQRCKHDPSAIDVHDHVHSSIRPRHPVTSVNTSCGTRHTTACNILYTQFIFLTVNTKLALFRDHPQARTGPRAVLSPKIRPEPPEFAQDWFFLVIRQASQQTQQDTKGQKYFPRVKKMFEKCQFWAIIPAPPLRSPIWSELAHKTLALVARLVP